MDKIIFILMTLVLAQCKSNEIVQVEEQKEEVTITATDTTKVEEEYVYRGDTLMCEVIFIGDDIISKKTYRKGYKNHMGMIAKRRTMAKGEVMPMETAMMDASSAPAPASPSKAGRIKPTVPQNPDAGQLTAGEWNDLNNWEDWKSLLNDNDYYEMQGLWGIYPTHRHSVFITNEKNTPIIDVKVDLLQGDKVIWTARTDHTGRAELWSSLTNKNDGAKSDMKAKAYIGGESYDISVSESESVHLEIVQKCNNATAVDIMFVVDATGSMGDEINYLKSELKDVVKRATAATDDLDLRIGSVFYRDGQDAYLTKVSPLSNNLEKAYEFINEQDAQGGGDFPEAVDAALEEALAQKWSNNAIARIVFLLLDAPPHDDNITKARIRDQINEAAERGIKLIPISASGINRETEFLLKFMSIATNGTYVFITDDSGIGNPHLAPLVDDFEVELLNDLLVRLISNYTTVQECDAQAVVNPEVKIYPNPTSNFITVEPMAGATEVRLISSSGMLLLKSKVGDEPIKIDLSQYVDGIYTVQCVGSDFTYGYPVIKVRE